jgi:hypothetical protein
MKNLTLVGVALRATAAIALAASGVASATAQTSNSMGGMQMAPGSKMEMKGRAPTTSAANTAARPTRTAPHAHHSHASRHHRR